MLRLKSMRGPSLIRRNCFFRGEFAYFAQPHIRTRFACPFLHGPGQSIRGACGAVVDNRNLGRHSIAPMEPLPWIRRPPWACVGRYTSLLVDHGCLSELQIDDEIEPPINLIKECC